MILTDGTTSVTLSNDLLWEDEAKWSPVAQSINHGLTGSLFVEEGTRQAGRPITLVAQDNMAWISRSTFESLISLASVAGKEMTLTMDEFSPDRVFTVMFRHADGALDLQSLKGFGVDEDYIIRAIRLMEI